LTREEEKGSGGGKGVRQLGKDRPKKGRRGPPRNHWKILARERWGKWEKMSFNYAKSPSLERRNKADNLIHKFLEEQAKCTTRWKTKKALNGGVVLYEKKGREG